MNTLLEPSSNKIYEIYCEFMEQLSFFIEQIGFKCGFNATLLFSGTLLLINIGLIIQLFGSLIWNMLTPGYKIIQYMTIIMSFIVMYLFHLFINELNKKITDSFTALKKGITEKDQKIAELTRKLEDKQRQLLNKMEISN